MANKINDHKSKKKKLHGFKNWLEWTNLTQVMLKKQKVCNLVDKSYAEPIAALQTWKKEKNNNVNSKIIMQRVNSNFYINNIGEKNPQSS